VAVMGIDPGLGGGIAILHPSDGISLERMPLIGNELDLKELSHILKNFSNDVRMAYLEKAQAMPKQGVSSMFKYGRVFGAIEALLTGHEIPFVLVTPQTWMKYSHSGISRDLDSKERSRMAFARLLPNVDARRTAKCKGPDMGLVEASLIADYGMRLS
jgi:crossover junction endodeoxyribonuclease RuvC